MTRASDDRWTVDDVVDFEYLVARDAGSGPAAARDAVDVRALAGDRRAVFLAWTRHRDPATGTTPGAVYRRARRLTSMLLVVTGFVVGAALAGSLLARRDAEPINALLFLGCTVGLQVALLVAVGLGSALAAALRAANVGLGPAREMALWLVTRLGRTIDRLDGARRTALRARWAAVDLRSERLGPLIGCQLLVVTQCFAIAFNAGLLAAMLLVYLPFEELRFGWQTTYSFTTGGVETAVRAIAAPWSWLSPTLVPDAAGIVATRYARGQRAETLPADAAHAWWPFLIAAIVFYGLATRLLVAGVGSLLLRRRLHDLRFTEPAANALWRRLAGPLLRSSGGTGRLPADRAPATPIAGGSVDLLVVDREWAAPADAVRSGVERLFDGPVARVASAIVDDDALPDDLAAALAGASTVVVATAASRDPIVAVAGFLKAVVARAPDAAITVVLMPDDGTAGGVPDERLAIWQRFVAIQRLRIGVERAR